MTTGHQHRVLRVRRGGLIHRALTVRIASTDDRARAERSPFAWGPDGIHYRLSLLGVLHGLTGLTLDVR